MSPEVMCAQNHTIAVDYFALGVLSFEFMFGFVKKNFNFIQRPYLGKSRKEIKEKIMAKQVQIKKNEIPECWSIEAADFINRVFYLLYKIIFQLLQRKPANRLGLRGAQEVKDHVWLKYYPWKDLYDKKLESPFIPKVYIIIFIYEKNKNRTETILMLNTVMQQIKQETILKKNMKLL